MCAPLLLVFVACVVSVRAEGSCPSCERVHEEGELLEAVKRHILSRLQLDARPNITQTLPRAALLTALRRLHAGRVRQDGRVELPTETRAHEDSTEIISFAERDEMVTSQSGFFFLVSNEGHMTASQASLWVYLRVLPVSDQRRRRSVSVKVYFQAPGLGSEWSLLEKRLDLRRSGWHTFDLTASVRRLFQSGQRRQNVDVRCDGCESEHVVPVLLDPDEDPHWPFMVVQAQQTDVHRIRKRGLECDGTGLCCRQQFFIDFRVIGWSDWIIAPSGYFGNYCEGRCPAYMSGIPSSASSFHTAVVNQYRIRGISPGAATSCCIPTRLSTMSMLYFDHEFNIVKRDVPNMIVEECGCA